MPLTIAKTADSGNTTLTINNFEILKINGVRPVDVIDDNTGVEADAIIANMFGPRMTVDLSYTIIDEASTVVSGTGSPVTTAVGQVKYLYDTLMSKGAESIKDTYTLTIDFGGGVTLVRTGFLSTIDTIITAHAPLTFQCSMLFVVGKLP